MNKIIEWLKKPINRRKFIFSYLFISFLATYVTFAIIFTNSVQSLGGILLSAIFAIYSIILISKRLRDMKVSQWFLLFNFLGIPFLLLKKAFPSLQFSMFIHIFISGISSLFLLWLAFSPSKKLEDNSQNIGINPQP